MPIRQKPANFRNFSLEEQEAWYSEQFSDVGEYTPPASSVSQAMTNVTAPPRRGLTNIQDWSEERFNIPGERLRNCIIYQLEYAKGDWYRENPITVASMGREKFVIKLDADTPVGWTPEKGLVSKKKSVRPLPNDIASWLMLGSGVNAPIQGFTSARKKLDEIKCAWYGDGWSSQPDPDIDYEGLFVEYERKRGIKKGE